MDGGRSTVTDFFFKIFFFPFKSLIVDMVTFSGAFESQINGRSLQCQEGVRGFSVRVVIGHITKHVPVELRLDFQHARCHRRPLRTWASIIFDQLKDTMCSCMQRRRDRCGFSCDADFMFF